MFNGNQHQHIARRLVTELLCVSVFLLTGRAALAQPVDGIEVLFGATNIHATTGHGGLTAGVSQDGDLTVLSWPSPSYFGQLHYMTTNGEGARNLERMGAREGMGGFSGIVLHLANAESPVVTFFHDDGWEQSVTFVDDDTSVIQCVFTNSGLGLTVLQTDFIPLDLDVLVRRTVVDAEPGLEITDAWLIGYTNLSPGLSRVPEVPVTDFLIDQHNDFLAVWEQMPNDGAMSNDETE